MGSSGCSTAPASSVDAGGADAGGPATPSAGVNGMVGAGGGTLENRKIKLTVPAGALAADTAITIDEQGAVPAEYGARSPAFRFGPAGVVFQKPVTVAFKIAAAADLTKVKVYWSRREGTGFEMVATHVAADRTVTGEVMHFSDGFAALPPGKCDDPERTFCGEQGVGTDCANLYVDTNNCGLCGNVCIGKGCIGGNCRSEKGECPSGFEFCGGSGVGTDCANLDVDPNNCGGCGNLCLGTRCPKGACE